MVVASMRNLYQKGVYFQADSSTFSYAATCLADGLNQLGIPIFSNIDYLEPLITDFSFKRSKDPSLPNKAACLLLDLQETASFNNKIVSIESSHDCFLALCMQDDVCVFCLQGPAALLCTHENRFRDLEGPRIPIGFGLSTAMLRRSIHITPDRIRKKQFLRNFRPSYNQEVRACLDLVLVPVLEELCKVESRLAGSERWSEEYFSLLEENLGCLAYGGCLAQDLSQNDYFRRLESCDHNLVNFHNQTVVLRWDSWRFWEALVFGCAAVQLDFERYGFKLPVMPENWQHYIGINLADVRSDLERMMDERTKLSEIAWNGRQWAIQNYSPVAVARRFLAICESLT